MASRVDRLLALLDTAGGAVQPEHASLTPREVRAEIYTLAREVAEAVKEKGLADRATCQHVHSLFYYCSETDGRKSRADAALLALCRDEAEGR